MGHAAIPSISEVVTFLREQAPALASAEDAIGDAALVEGIALGRPEDGPAGADERALKVRAEVVVKALAPMVSRSKAQVASIDAKLLRLAQLKFIGGLCAALAAPGSILAIVLAQSHTAVALAAVSFVGTLAQMLAEMLVLAPGRKEADLVELSRQLSGAATYGDLTRRTLAGLLKGNAGSEHLASALKEANVQFGALNDALSKPI